MSNLILPTYDENNNLTMVPASVQTLANNILTALNRAYPDWSEGWSLQIDNQGGIVQVRNLLISGKMGFIMKINDIDYEMRKMVYFAGELLERYRLSREKGTDVVDSVNNMQRAGTGEAVHDT